MHKKLQELQKRYKELEEQLGQPQVFSDRKKLEELSKEYKELTEVIEKYQQLQKITSQIEEAKRINQETQDLELKQIATKEIEDLSKQEKLIRQQLTAIISPKDPYGQKDVIMEIRAATGGGEAALFAADLLRMYKRYAENKTWKIEILSVSKTEIQGIKEIIFAVTDSNVYERLKYERGVHRVQRIPETEKSGRIHTSTATVAVLPQAEEKDIEIDPKDLRIDVFRSSGKGGQNVNKVETAVRITHLLTNTTVACQDERSQQRNRAKAMQILRSRLLARKEEAKEKKEMESRRKQIGKGERSEKIRTYNFPQDRVTDHRINLSLHNLEGIMNGNLDPLIDKLVEADNKSS